MIFKEREQYKRRKKKKNRKKKKCVRQSADREESPKESPKTKQKEQKNRTKLFFSSLTESAGKKLDADCCASSIGLLFFTESDNRRCFVFDSFLF